MLARGTKTALSLHLVQQSYSRNKSLMLTTSSSLSAPRVWFTLHRYINKQSVCGTWYKGSPFVDCLLVK